MSHCALEATLKPKRRFQFTPRIVVWNAFVAQVYQELVLFQTRGFCRQMCGVCVEQRTMLSVDERSWRLGPSETKCTVCRQPSMEVPGRTKTSKRNMPVWSDTSLDRKPVQLKQNWRDVVHSSSSSEKHSGLTELCGRGWEAGRRAVNYSSPGDLIWMPERVFWLHCVYDVIDFAFSVNLQHAFLYYVSGF